MSLGQTKKLPLIERVERALILLAYCVELDGDVHVPMYEKLEAELEALKKTNDARLRARERLDAFRGELASSSGLMLGFRETAYPDVYQPEQ
jgi:hypothetical protein